MFKLFNREKGHQSPFKAPSLTTKDEIGILKNEISLLKFKNDNIDAINAGLCEKIIALESARKVYAGQKFYDPKNHKSPTIYLCARWNEWYVVRAQNEATPRLITASEFNDQYGSYVLMPKQNLNRKNLS